MRPRPLPPSRSAPGAPTGPYGLASGRKTTCAAPWYEEITEVGEAGSPPPLRRPVRPFSGPGGNRRQSSRVRLPSTGTAPQQAAFGIHGQAGERRVEGPSGNRFHDRAYPRGVPIPPSSGIESRSVATPGAPGRFDMATGTRTGKDRSRGHQSCKDQTAATAARRPGKWTDPQAGDSHEASPPALREERHKALDMAIVRSSTPAESTGEPAVCADAGRGPRPVGRAPGPNRNGHRRIRRPDTVPCLRSRMPPRRPF